MTKEREGEWFMVGSAFFESWFPIFSISAMAYVGALHTYAYSLVVALFFFLVIMYRRARFSELRIKQAYPDLLWTTFWITTLFVLIFIGMQYTTAGNMAVIIFLQLLFSYLYFNLLGHEQMHKFHLFGALIMGIGALVILIPEDMAFNRGDLLILVAAAIAPVANLYQKRAREYCSSETILAFRTVIGLPVVAMMAFLFEPTVSMEMLKQAMPYIFLIGTIVYVGSKILWIEALHRTSITKVSAMMGLMPVMTIIFAYLYLGEVPQLRQVFGIIPVVAGGYLLTRPLTQQ
ncbi:DMT family transporter [Sulfurovum sp. zt1-1]|uniref:DMT family transporter n=1 Tax=Sulfurovum zhangzhouensis TaxID=3019067 RepID=A0ABT7QYG3_9BACT|nr:DMT family transporter [Sulfurovum zhangzhouensis]MDM5271871.1 DMT family transporter [Sulfurovum zhangzhouensis]